MTIDQLQWATGLVNGFALLFELGLLMVVLGKRQAFGRARPRLLVGLGIILVAGLIHVPIQFLVGGAIEEAFLIGLAVSAMLHIVGLTFIVFEAHQAGAAEPTIDYEGPPDLSRSRAAEQQVLDPPPPGLRVGDGTGAGQHERS